MRILSCASLLMGLVGRLRVEATPLFILFHTTIQYHVFFFAVSEGLNFEMIKYGHEFQFSWVFCIICQGRFILVSFKNFQWFPSV